MAEHVVRLFGSGPGYRMKIVDGVARFSVYDFMTVACSYAPKSSTARSLYSRLISDKSEFKNEVVALCNDLKFTGNGQKPTPTMTIRGLQRLLMILGNKVAAEYRAEAETAMTRVLAGDMSLVKVLEANANSDSPINQMMRDALINDPQPQDADLERLAGIEPPVRISDQELQLAIDDKLSRKRKQELEELEIQERRLALETKKTGEEMRKVDFLVKHIKETNEIMKDYGHFEDRDKLRTSAVFRNIQMMTTRNISGQAGLFPEIEDAPNATADIPRFVTISSVCGDAGYHRFDTEDFKQIGVITQRLYLKEHGEYPSKHTETLPNGREIRVNDYLEKDQSIIIKAITEHLSNLEAKKKQNKIDGFFSKNSKG